MILFEETLAVLCGGGMGSVFRFYLQRQVQELHLEGGFPYGVFLANVLGSLIIGFLAAFLVGKFHLSPVWRAGIFIGLLGGFTTFSSFSLDTVTLIQSGNWIPAIANVGLSLTLCLLATTLGLFLGKLFI